ncbi:MAG: hypothetical protein JWR84_3982 [Caulobacter sp.]|nr:hypothetical protein [Caulobacter sp.]
MIKSLALGLTASMLMVAAPSAQTPPVKTPPSKAPSAAAPTPAPPAAPMGPPRAFPGYTQPEVGAAACRVVSQTQVMCTIPSMVAGRYMARASGTSTAQGEGAAQALVITVGGRACGRVDRRPTKENPWTTGPKTLVGDCEFVVVTDRPLQVIATYGDAKATKDARGPTLKIDRLPWDGVMSANMTAPEQPQ